MRITKKWLVVITAILFSALVAVAASGCIPVTVRPQFDDKGLPVALPVTPVGSISPEGVFAPVYPVSSEPPTPPKDWGPLLEQGLTLALGLLVGGGAAMPVIRKLRLAVGQVANLADAQASAETDEDVARNKLLAKQMQEAAGIRNIIQKARGK